MVIKHCGFDKRFALLHFYIGEGSPQYYGVQTQAYAL